MIEHYRRSGVVAYAEPDYVVRKSATPNDPEFGNQWGLHNTGQALFQGVADADADGPAGWDFRTSASSVIVAVIDSGVRYTHQDLAANMWVNAGEIAGNDIDDDNNGFIDDVHGINAIDGSGDPMDDDGHGTHVAGTIGAVGNNGIGGTGVAWQAQIMACKFLDSTGNGFLSDGIACIDYARLKGAHVLNNSWGFLLFEDEEAPQSLADAITATNTAGLVFVAAAGNAAVNTDFAGTRNYPSGYSHSNIVAVAATDSRDRLSSFSNWGPTTIDLAAPGTDILSTSLVGDDQYEYMSGTSMATPHVSGAFALAKALYPAETHNQLITRVMNATVKLPALRGLMVTQGRLNLAMLLGPTAPSIAIADRSVTEGNSGTTGSTVTVTSSASRPWAVRFRYQTADNTATTVATSPVFSNGSALTIPDRPSDEDPVAPVSSTITVPPLSGVITRVVVAIDSLTHTWPADVNLLLVGPTGIKVKLMSGAGEDTPVTNQTYFFVDTGARMVASSANGGTYRPSDLHGGTISSPAGPYGFELADFRGTSATGTWTLHAWDDTHFDSGSIGGGWSLEISTATPGDYHAQHGYTTIAAGATAANVGIVVHGDTAVEGDETFSVNLTDVGGATVADAMAVVTINDDEPGATPTPTPPTPTPTPTSIPAGTTGHLLKDFNGDGRHDLVWRRKTDGLSGVWFLGGAQGITTTSIGLLPTTGAAWDMVAFGDFSQDGRADIVLQNQTTGAAGYWRMDGLQYLGATAFLTPAAGWKIVGAAHMNGDTKPDLVLRNENTGEAELWLMDGATRTGTQLLSNPGVNWEIVAVADFDGDDDSDLVWRNRVTGVTGIWLMNGTTFVSAFALPAQDTTPNWLIVDAADYDQNSSVDFFWRQKITGQNGVWFMDGENRQSISVVETVDGNWEAKN